MIPENRIPTHPGLILSEEFLKPLGISQQQFAAHLGISSRKLGMLLREKQPVTAQLAWALSQALGTTPELWLNLQTAHDLARSRPHQTISPVPRAV